MRARFTAFLLAAVVLAVATSTVVTAGKAPFGGIVVFGTSLSDPGNAFALVGGNSTPPSFDLDALLVPSAAYARGGHHFSNGSTWVEQLAQPLGLGSSVQPAFRSASPNAMNFAVGGARARDVVGNPSLSVQMAAFLQKTGGVARPDALYVIEMGGNDIRDALTGDPNTIFPAALQSIGGAVTQLYIAGARRFLIWRAPDVGLAPALRLLGPQAQAGATLLSDAFNGGLDAVVGQLSHLTGISIARLDASGLLEQIVADPAAFNLTNATTACVTPNVPPFTCQQPDQFMFWDGIHPTSAGHAIIAKAAADIVLH